MKRLAWSLTVPMTKTSNLNLWEQTMGLNESWSTTTPMSIYDHCSVAGDLRVRSLVPEAESACILMTRKTYSIDLNQIPYIMVKTSRNGVLHSAHSISVVASAILCMKQHLPHRHKPATTLDTSSWHFYVLTPTMSAHLSRHSLFAIPLYVAHLLIPHQHLMCGLCRNRPLRRSSGSSIRSRCSMQ